MGEEAKHTCNADIDAKLEPLNGKLARGFFVDDGKLDPTPVFIEVVKIQSRGKRPPKVMATFCPFCGRSLSKEPHS